MLWFIILSSVFSFLVRVLPHLPNVAPIAALALFAGTYLPKRWGWAVPLLVMFTSDLFVGFYDVRLMAVVYASFLIPFFIGWLLRKDKNSLSIFAGSLSGSVIFFLTTNFAVWALSNWYPHTLSGLLWSYTAGLPFFRNSLVGDLLYTGLFFGAYAVLPYLKKWFAFSYKVSAS